MMVISLRRFQIMVVGGRLDEDLDAIRKAWQRAGAELLGPVTAADATRMAWFELDGALVSLASDQARTEELASLLEAADVPFLFVLPATTGIDHRPFFHLSDDPAIVAEMIGRLSAQAGERCRH
jgi:hypothetical protein